MPLIRLVHYTIQTTSIPAMMNGVHKESMTVAQFDVATVEKIDTLDEEGYDYDSMIEFIQEHSESDFINYYEDYVSFGDQYSYEAADAFIQSFDMNSLPSIEDAYYGSYNDEAEFAECYFDEMNYEIPDFVVVDWEATWEANLRHDFVFNNGYVFNRNF